MAPCGGKQLCAVSKLLNLYQRADFLVKADNGFLNWLFSVYNWYTKHEFTTTLVHKHLSFNYPCCNARPHVIWPTLSCRIALLWMEYILENAYLTMIACFTLLRFKQQEFTYRKPPFVILAFFGLKNIVAMLFNIVWYVFLDMNTWMHVCVYIYT